MSNQTSDNNKRIAKNTLLLYFRMFIMMAVSLFTSRVILQTLGVEDFGIYNVVGGIVAMMGMFNGAMSSSIQRYLSYEIGKENKEQLRKTFNVCFFIYVFMCIVFLLAAETVGLWFLNTQLVIPNDRIIAANWVYQFSIFSVVNSLLVNPYNATIISHEKMGVFAYISILEVILKLVIVYLLLIIPIDRLIVYGFLFMLMSVAITMVYRIYCIRHFPESHIKWYSDRVLFKQLLSYSGWNLFGSVAGVVKGQGLNILLNMFFNPSVNAARGIAYQINTQVSNFFSNFYTAVRPQITKYYAQGKLNEMTTLVFQSSKFAYYLILLLSLPIIVEAPFIIDLWLGQLPEYVVQFVRIILVVTAVDAMANPIMTTAHATGKIALYQSVVGTMTIFNIPISYMVLKYGNSPVSVFVVSLLISVLCMFTRLLIVRKLVNFPVKLYIKQVYGRVILVTVFSLILPLILYRSFEVNLWSAIFVCSVCLVSTCISVYSFGLTKHERLSIVAYVTGKIKRLR